MCEDLRCCKHYIEHERAVEFDVYIDTWFFVIFIALMCSRFVYLY